MSSRTAFVPLCGLRLRVRRLKRGEDGRERPEGFVYAGIMTYEKVQGRWMKVANVATAGPQ